MEAIDYRKYLKSALADICAKRPGYSMRAFAKRIQLSPSHFSRVLNGEKDLSYEAAQFEIRIEQDQTWADPNLEQR